MGFCLSVNLGCRSCRCSRRGRRAPARINRAILHRGFVCRHQALLLDAGDLLLLLGAGAAPL